MYGILSSSVRTVPQMLCSHLHASALRVRACKGATLEKFSRTACTPLHKHLLVELCSAHRPQRQASVCRERGAIRHALNATQVGRASPNRLCACINPDSVLFSFLCFSVSPIYPPPPAPNPVNPGGCSNRVWLGKGLFCQPCCRGNHYFRIKACSG